jgi:CheY-like chemotaxis protein
VDADPSLQSAVRGLQILVVEDDIDTQESLCALMEHFGAHVTCASSAVDAVRLVADGLRYDVVVSDLELPGHDGLWLVAELRRLAPPAARPWAVLLTGSARPGVERLAVHAGFDVYLKKPAGADALLRAIVRGSGSGSR